MIGLDLALRQVAFAQARSSSAEAMMILAGHQQEIARVTGAGGVTVAQEAEHFAELADELRKSAPMLQDHAAADDSTAASHIDKLA